MYVARIWSRNKAPGVEPDQRKEGITIASLTKFRAFALIYLIGLLIAQGYLVAKYASGELVDTASAALHLVGVYAIMVGLMLRSRFTLVTEAMTSPNPLIFTVGNTALLPLATSVVRLLSTGQSGESFLYNLLRRMLTVLLLVIELVFLLFHMLVIVPLAWIAYLVANLVIDLVLSSGVSIKHEVGENLEVMRTESIVHGETKPLDAGKKSNTMTVREFLTQNRGEAVSFFVGAPAIMFGLILKMLAVF